MAPIYRQLRQSGIKITHCAFPHYLPVLEGFVDGTLPYPLQKNEADKYDRIVWLENIIEGKSVADDEHPHDRMSARFGLPPSEQKAEYLITPEEKQWAGEEWPRTSRKRICLQAWSSTDVKNYPGTGAVMAAIHQEDHEILVVGSPQPVDASCPPLPNTIYDCTFKRHTIRQSIAMASTCDAIVAPDSVFVHVGHALDIPVVGLFGPFDGKAYMLGYKGKPIQGLIPCSPCGWHPRGTPFPPDMPCARHGKCISLGQVSPGFIITILRRYL